MIIEIENKMYPEILKKIKKPPKKLYLKGNIKILQEYANLSDKEKIEIKSLKRGECLMFVGEDHILTKIESSDLEKEIIEGENKIAKNYNSYE